MLARCCWLPAAVAVALGRLLALVPSGFIIMETTGGVLPDVVVPPVLCAPTDTWSAATAAAGVPPPGTAAAPPPLMLLLLVGFRMWSRFSEEF